LCKVVQHAIPEGSRAKTDAKTQKKETKKLQVEEQRTTCNIRGRWRANKSKKKNATAYTPQKNIRKQTQERTFQKINLDQKKAPMMLSLSLSLSLSLCLSVSPSLSLSLLSLSLCCFISSLFLAPEKKSDEHVI